MKSAKGSVVVVKIKYLNRLLFPPMYLKLDLYICVFSGVKSPCEAKVLEVDVLVKAHTAMNFYIT